MKNRDSERLAGQHATQTDEGYRLIANAARLMRYCAGYVTDRKAQQDGWKLYYAVDTDVIKLFMAPDQMAEYANVFEERDAADTSKLLARLLGNFIFRPSGRDDVLSRASGGNLFILSPHDGEIGRMVFDLSQKLIDEIDAADSRIEDFIAKISNQLEDYDGDEVAQWLIDNAPALIEVFDGKSGPRSELDRFESLDESRVLHIERYKEGSNPPWAFPLPTPTGNVVDFQPLMEMFGDWKKRLIECKTPRQSMRAVVNDAYVLSVIEWLNIQMAESKRRVLLISGTHGVHWATEKYFPAQTHATRRTFADLYVRHPQFVMVDSDFFPDIAAADETRESGSFRLFDWLNLFFPDVIRSKVHKIASIDTQLLKNIQDNADTEFKEAVVLLAKSEQPTHGRSRFPQSMIDEWQTQVRSASIAKSISDNEASWPQRAKDLLCWLRDRITSDWTVDQLRHDLANRALQSLSALYSSTVWLGLWSRVGAIPEQIRGIPVLRIDEGYESVHKYCCRVLEAMKAATSANNASDMDRLDIADMYSKLAEIDSSNYHSHLVHALAYASKGHWHAASTLCKIALRTADGVPKHHGELRRGREAAYLLSISERRLARKMGDLVTAEKYLREAIRRENDGAQKDLRFRSEEIAIRVAKLNFGYFLDSQECDTHNECKEILRDATELLLKVGDDPNADCRAWITQQASTNSLNTALILQREAGDLPPELIEFIRKILSHPIDCSIGDSTYLGDAVSKFIYFAAFSVFNKDAVSKTKARNTLKDIMFPNNLPFDKNREKLFRQMANDTSDAAS